MPQRYNKICTRAKKSVLLHVKMKIEHIYDIVSRRAQVESARQAIVQGQAVMLCGLHGSLRQLSLQAVLSATSLPEAVIVYPDYETALYAFHDLESAGAPVLMFPLPTDEGLLIQRTGVLETLAARLKDDKRSPLWIVTFPEALDAPVPEPANLHKQTVTLRTGDTLPVSRLGEQLLSVGFERVDFVYQPGQYAIRGGIVDVYSYAHDYPYRLDFFGDEIDSIRTFDLETQLSVNVLDRQSAICLTGKTLGAKNSIGFEAYLPPKTLRAVCNEEGVRMHFNNDDEPCTEISFSSQPQPIFHKHFDLLEADLRNRQEAGYQVFILAEHKKQTDRLQAIFEGASLFQPVEGVLHEGFVDHDAKVCCYTDHELFERYHRVATGSDSARRGKAIMTLKELNQMRLGDYVVHSDHGIGQFGGLVTTPVNGKPQEMIKLTYRDGDTIFVSIHNLHRISKYKGREGSAPTIAKIGSSAWERLKERTKDKVKDIARDLIRLYASRQKQPGFAYTPDGYLQHELEASFLYEDTPDQAKATLEVKADMERATPMDRLICGDVGFGKTEIAMRAAFKAVTDSKQVAVLVPTTVLALQHYNTFRERFKDFPVRVEYLSRSKNAKETADILKRLANGQIDILIGTHKLTGENVKWHDLGLVIIDEEQKFGVAVKERLKRLRTHVDVLTLTATPIPRTLQFSLLGARDLSVMTTAPQNRYPVQTEVVKPEEEDIIKDAINYELSRNGQVFVVNNRIDMLERTAHRLQRLCPDARIVIAHGQMPPAETEERLEAFINYDYDILLSTTIIESGVDIPNVNTIIIYSAQHYGLSDLHQLRGRVGRSNRKAYCYLIAPERELLTADARRRLDAITTFGELGAGFQLAMQDLDIRGAGNLLGAEQSGFIADLGYETYQKILNEAVAELKEEEGLTAEEETSDSLSIRHSNDWVADSQLESDLQLCFPQDYVENISERLTLYKELDSLRNEDELTAYRKRLIDRFGPLSEQAEELLNVVRLRWLCCRMGIEKIYLKGERMTLYFITSKEQYWQSDIFGKILLFATYRPERCKFVEDTDSKGRKTGKRHVTILQVKTLAGAIHLLNKILES